MNFILLVPGSFSIDKLLLASWLNTALTKKFNSTVNNILNRNVGFILNKKSLDGIYFFLTCSNNVQTSFDEIMKRGSYPVYRLNNEIN